MMLDTKTSSKQIRTGEWNSSSIAILPFVNISSDHNADAFSLSIVEQLISFLSGVKGLQVASRTSSFSFENQKLDVQEIARKLNVYYILEGSVRKINNRVRVTAQLINTTNGFQLWSEMIDREFGDPFDVQDEISAILVKKVCRSLLFGKSGSDNQEHRQLNIFHYKSFLKGKFLIEKFEKEEIDKGIALLKDILVEYPEYTQAYLQLNKAYIRLGQMGLMDCERAKSIAQLKLNKALELDPDLPDCNFHQSLMYFFYEWDLISATQYLRKAIKLFPDSPAYYRLLGIFYCMERKFTKAMRAIDKSFEVNSIADFGHYYKALVNYFQGKYDLAVGECRKSAESNPGHIFSHTLLVRSLISTEKFEDALKYIESLPEDVQVNLEVKECRAITMFYLGQRQAIMDFIQSMNQLLSTEMKGMAACSLIRLYAVTDDNEKAVTLINEEIQKKSPKLIPLLLDPMLKEVFKDQRVQELVREQFKERYSEDRPDSKSKKSTLSIADLEIFYTKLERFMENEAPYLDQSLSRGKLAKYLDLHPNQLSQLLNEKLGKNFAEYINSHRLEAFLQKTKDPASRQLTILALAFECGFSSKTVFNTFFKQRMGMTPSTYWKAISTSSKPEVEE